MKNLAIMLCGMLLATAAAAETPPDTLWAREFGGGEFEWGRSVQETRDGGFITVGDTYSYGTGGFDVWLIKTDGGGNKIWAKTYGGIYEDRGYSVRQTADGGYVIAGVTGSYGVGAYDIWLIKTDGSGHVSWSRTFGGIAWDWGYSVEQTGDGGYVLAGYTESFGPGDSALWLIRTDSAGDTLWTRTVGGESSDWGQCVRVCSDEGYLVAGSTYSFGAGSRDVWLVRTDSAGDTLWTRTFGGGASDAGHAVTETADGGCLLTGYTKSFGAGQDDVWLIRTDSSGDTLWTRTYGGAQSDGGESVDLCFEGGCIVAGHTKSFGAGGDDFWLIRAADNGDTLWTKTLGGDNHDWARSVQQCSDGGYIVAGDTYSFTEGQYDIWLARLAPGTGVQATTEIGAVLRGLRSYPNPFGPSTTIATIEFETVAPGIVSLDVYDVSGRMVRSVVRSELPAQLHRLSWNGTDDAGRRMPSGTYFYRVQLAGDTIAEKITFLR